MKKICIKALYNLLSFLSDFTNGFRPFVKCKIVLGSMLLIGFTMTSCRSKVIYCYAPYREYIPQEQVPDTEKEVPDTSATAVDSNEMITKKDVYN